MKIKFFLLLSFVICAKAHPGRIIGGTKVQNISEVPYQLSLRMYGAHKCGASVISSTWALSAGHCLYDGLEVSSLTLIAGVLELNSAGAINIFDVAEYHRHPDYDLSNYDYDVAVARVTRSFFEVPLVKAIRLSTQEMPLVVGEMTLVAGWGITESGTLSTDLLKVEVPVVSYDTCYSFWSSKLTDRMFCAGGVVGYDSCTGDSGGPLNFRNLQVGIVSFGVSACGSNVPAGYTSIAHPSIRKFIRQWTGV